MTRVEVFEFNTATLVPPEEGEEEVGEEEAVAVAAPQGTWEEVITSIHGGVVQRSVKERVHPQQAKLLGPSEFNGKTVMPRCKEIFVVRVTNTRGQVVSYLFEWNTLYNIGFHVENDRCWYLYRGHESVILPPQDQFLYDSVYILPIKSDYGGLGRKEIMLGVEAFDGYVCQLFTLRADMRRYGRKLQKFKLDQPKINELKKGALTFGPVVISEPSRFADYQEFMGKNIRIPIHVAEEYTDYFTLWSGLSEAVRNNEPLKDGNDNILLTVEQVRAKVCLLC